MLTDEELLRRLAVDPMGAIAEVFEIHGPPLLGRLRRHASLSGYGDANVDDVFVETLLKLAEPSYRAGLRARGGNILAYLTQWGKWRLGDAFRGRADVLPETLAARVHPEEPEEAVLSPVARAFERLSPRDQDILNWTVIEKCSHREIASRLSISEGAAKKAAHDARSRFRDLLREEGAST